MTTTAGLRGLTAYRRPNGGVGVRNHVLLLPSVMCSAHVAAEIAGDGPAIAITHQHGCLQVGDDLRHTRFDLVGTAINPNVAGVVVVSLGCETINGSDLAIKIASHGQQVELVGIQAAGGTRRAVEAGRAAARTLVETAAAGERVSVDMWDLIVGIDAPDDALSAPIIAALGRRGVQVLVAIDSPRGAEAHVALAAGGAQIIVSLPRADEAAIGFVVCPVVAVGRDTDLHRALSDDFDVIVESDEDEGEMSDRVTQRVLAHARGELTASERRAARDFVLRRLAVTM
jgi:altronate dehydratase